MASSLETNKALAALLTAGIIASGSGVIARILYHPSMPEENAYVIQVTQGEAEGGEAAAEAKTPPLPVLLAAASSEAGQGVVKKCAACHSFEQGGPNKIGPVLWGVVGRDIASVEGFSYSDALLAKEGEWTFDKLFQFIHNPKGYAPGTKMAFAGIGDPEDLADVLVYLRGLSENPVPLPEVAEAEVVDEEAAEAASTTDVTAQPDAAAESAKGAVAEEQVAALEQTEEGAADANGGIGVRLAEADLGTGERAAKKCAACHSFDEGGPAKIGPPLWGVVGRDIAGFDDFAYSDALTEKEGNWDYQKLDAFLTQPRDWAPGTKMAFVGLKKPEERADLILYLRSLSNEPAPLP